MKIIKIIYILFIFLLFLNNIFSDIKDDFFKALKRNDINEVKKFLESDSGLANTQSILKEYPIIPAVKSNNYEMVKLLISYGAKVDVTDNTKKTPIEIAIKEKNNKIAELLIENGANVESTDIQKNSMLILCCINDNYDIAKKLIEYKADVNKRNSMNESPLALVLKKDNLKLAKLLIDNGANINEVDNLGNSLLLNAIDDFKIEKARFLLENGANVDIQNKSGKTCLHIIANNVFENKEIEKFEKELLPVLKEDDRIFFKKVYHKNLPKKISTNDMDKSILPYLTENEKEIVLTKYIKTFPDKLEPAIFAGIFGKLKTNKEAQMFLQYVYKEEAVVDEEAPKGKKQKEEDIQFVFIYKGELKKDELLTVNNLLTKYNYEKSEDKNLIIKKITIDLLTEGGYYENNISESYQFVEQVPVPQEINNIYFESLILNKIKNNDDKTLVASNYIKDSSKQKYILKQDITGEDKNKIKKILDELDYFSYEKGIWIEKVWELFKKVNYKYDDNDKYVLKSKNNKETAKIMSILYPIYYKSLANDIVKKTKNIDIKDFDNKRTPLLYAVKNENLELINMLLDNNANPNEVDFSGMNALHFVAITGHIDIINLLINKKVNVNLKDKKGKLPLHYAIENIAYKPIEILVNAGSNLKEMDNEGVTPVVRASLIKETEIDTYKLLFQFEKDINNIEYKGNKLIHIAASSGNVPLVKYLIEELKCDVNVTVPIRFQEKISKGALEGKFVNLSENYIKTIKNFYTLDNDFYVLNKNISENDKLLLGKALSKTDYVNNDGLFTPIHFACKGNSSEYGEIINILNNNKCNLLVKDYLDRTPLHYAAMKGYNIIGDIMKVYPGDKINEKDFEGKTPLHYAVEYGSVLIVEALAGPPAIIDIPVFENNILAKLQEDDKNFLLKCYDKGKVYFLKSSVRDRSSKDRKKILEILAKINFKVINVNEKDNFGWTPLHYAVARLVDSEIVLTLLEANADIKIKDNQKNSPVDLLNIMSGKHNYGNKLKVIKKEDVEKKLKYYKNFTI